MVACIYDKEDILAVLLQNGADLGAKDNVQLLDLSFRSALHVLTLQCFVFLSKERQCCFMPSPLATLTA
jgi:hypothetical protein